ncbi:hypothetical protein FJD35_23540 [Pseudomonas mandelii]|nr:hypothetical protein FJD35_23540 [Pseudomonas mandelii]
MKKSAMVSTAEKYALEIEIFTLSRGFRAQISHSCVQKRRFQQSVCVQSGRTDFFNTIGRFLPVTKGRNRPRLCKNVFERERYSKPDWKSRFYAKSTSADVPINFRFNVDAHTSIFAKRFYTLWTRSGRSP